MKCSEYKIIYIYNNLSRKFLLPVNKWKITWLNLGKKEFYILSVILALIPNYWRSLFSSFTMHFYSKIISMYLNYIAVSLGYNTDDLAVEKIYSRSNQYSSISSSWLAHLKIHVFIKKLSSFLYVMHKVIAPNKKCFPTAGHVRNIFPVSET